MLNWNVLVRERLNGRGLTDAQQNEVVAELAAHLEDLYEHERSSGVDEAGATCRALDDVADWRQLSRKISRSKNKEEQMNFRTRSLWLPGFACSATALVTLSVMNHSGISPKIMWYGSKVGLELYLPWLLALPLFGGLGAYLSRRAHGQLLARLAAALFPTIFFFDLFCFILALSGMIERHLTLRELPVVFSLTVLNWVLIPGAALALGALPFLRSPHVRKAEKSTL